jgi:hypothetical protein
MNRWVLGTAAAVVAGFLTASPAHASAISVSLGNTGSGFADGSLQSSGTVGPVQTGQAAPFNAFCGSDTTALIGNCNTSWTFTYVVPVNETVTAGTLTLGIWDLDAAAAGDQVATYGIAGGESLTAALNAAANALVAPAGGNSRYNIFTLALSNFAGLGTGSATVNLTLQAPGLGVIPTNFNGAGLIFSTLDLTTTANGSGPGNPVVPEPGTLLLLGSGLAMAARARARLARSKN